MPSRFRPVPDSPNCVSSRAPAHDGQHYIEPFAQAELHAIKAAMLAMPRTRLVVEEPGYLKFEVRTRFFRFVDDVEFELEDDGLVHVRSASRVGRSDLGVNRRRVEAIRKAVT